MLIKSIPVSKLNQIRKQGKALALIDVVPSANFAKSHVAHSLNTPLANLNPSTLMAIRGDHANEPLYIICQAGLTSVKACEKFIEAGFENVINIEGGKNAWRAAGLPLEKETTTSSQNKSKGIMGLIILLGAVLSLLMHPAFIALSLCAGLWLFKEARSLES